MKRRQGFTLIEVLTVVAIIAILATILVPTAGHMIEKARRAQAASHLRQVALAYAAHNLDTGFSSTKAKDFPDFIRILGHKNGLRDLNIWIQKDDPRVARRKDSIPRNIESVALETFPISIAVATALPTHAPASTTPVAWTRGLKSDGYWDAEIGVYGKKGGFIAFLDGHVQWYDDIATEHNQLSKPYDNELTCNIQEAIGGHDFWEQIGVLN